MTGFRYPHTEAIEPLSHQHSRRHYATLVRLLGNFALARLLLSLLPEPEGKGLLEATFRRHGQPQQARAAVDLASRHSSRRYRRLNPCNHSAALESASAGFVSPPAVHRQEMPMKITVETLVAAPIARVWQAYTKPADIVRWNAASDDWHTTSASVDLREGGAFSSRMEAKDGSMGFDFAGTYTRVVEQQLIEYAFGDRKAEVYFTPTPTGVSVRVSFDAETMHSPEQQQAGWQAILQNFARHVEAGN